MQQSAVESLPEGTSPLREQIEALERRVIARTLAAVSGNQSEAARRLGLNRGTLIERVRKYGLAGGAMNSAV
jgi:two-component system response regulator AtoC